MLSVSVHIFFHGSIILKNWIKVNKQIFKVGTWLALQIKRRSIRCINSQYQKQVALNIHRCINRYFGEFIWLRAIYLTSDLLMDSIHAGQKSNQVCFAIVNNFCSLFVLSMIIFKIFIFLLVVFHFFLFSRTFHL